MSAKKQVEKLAEKAGIEINGDRPWDIQVHNEDFYNRILSQGSLGLGESYMDGWWDCERLDEMIAKAFKADLYDKMKFNWKMGWYFLKAVLFNLQSKSMAYIVGEEHYDIGNELYEEMLDDLMIYSCGYWKEADDLNEAQRDKLDLICRKLKLEEDMSVLDIGCGWGGFCKYAAEEYGVEVVGLTISKEQAKLARKMCEGLPVEIKFQDYREEYGKYDRVVSIGMFEHVGYKNYRNYMEVVERCLKDSGLSMLHTIGGNKTTRIGNAWMQKYIFPNGMIPSIRQVGRAMEKLLVMEDWHNFGPYYDKTLMSWWDNVKNKLGDLGYDERFQRMWRFYLLSCAGAFRARHMQLWQVVLSKNWYDDYESVR